MSPVDYHAWTHRPKALGGTDPIEIGASTFRAMHFNDDVGDDITVGGTTNVNVTYNYWNADTYNTSVFRPETISNGTPTLGTHNVQHVDLLAAGLYVISWGLHWSTSFTAVVQMLLHDGDLAFQRPEVIYHASSGSGFAELGYLGQTVSRYYPTLDPFDDGPFTPIISTDVAQASGVSRTVTEAWLDISYFAANA